MKACMEKLLKFHMGKRATEKDIRRFWFNKMSFIGVVKDQEMDQQISWTINSEYKK